MTKRRRTILFLALAFLFLLTAPTVLLFSQGYRFDWGTGRVTQVGAFFFDVNPSPANITVDGKSIGKTARFIGSSLTKNFLPKTYSVQISKEGYYAWEKNLQIRPRQVTEAKNIILFPQNLSFTTLREGIERYWKAPEGGEAIIQMNFKDDWTLSLWDIEGDLAYEFYRARKSTKGIAEIEWAPDATRVLIKDASGASAQYSIHILDRDLLGAKTIDSEDISVIDLDFLGQNIRRISFSPALKEQLILTKQVQDSTVLYLADYELEELLNPIAQNVVDFSTRDQNLYWLDENGTVWQKDITSSSPADALNSIPISIQEGVSHEIFFIGSTMFVKQEKNLYQFDSQVQNFQIISVVAQDAVLSPDGKKFALTNESEIFTYYIANDAKQPKHETGDQVFLTRFSQKVENLVWLNSHYVAFVHGDTIKIAEIDNRDRINIIDIAQFPGSLRDDSNITFFWDSPSRILYVHANTSIHVSAELIQ